STGEITKKFVGSNPFKWIDWGNFLKAEASFAAIGAAMSLLRAMVTGTDPEANLKAFQKGFGPAAGQGIMMEFLLGTTWGEQFFEGGRKGSRYVFISRILSIIRGILFAPPNQTKPKSGK